MLDFGPLTGNKSCLAHGHILSPVTDNLLSLNQRKSEFVVVVVVVDFSQKKMPDVRVDLGTAGLQSDFRFGTPAKVKGISDKRSTSAKYSDYYYYTIFT